MLLTSPLLIQYSKQFLCNSSSERHTLPLGKGVSTLSNWCFSREEIEVSQRLAFASPSITLALYRGHYRGV
jgi:hypothetical protein